MLENKNILIGITGGIAAYKMCELIRRFKKSGANVRIVCTPNALNFVTKLTLQNLSQNEVYVEEFDVKDWKPEHISFADEADIMLIAPSTANTISKIAQGIADNLLTSIACAFSKKMIIAPAMNCNMWQNPGVKDNIRILKARGVEILEPESGFLACGYLGKGRLCSIDKIFNAVSETLCFSEKLKGKKVVITSGGTIEDIDPVRYISNYSSGKMGFALASCAKSMGAEVVLITTKDFEAPYKIAKVKSALDMQKALDEEFETSDIIIMAAAVADYRVKNYSQQKMKKGENDELTLELVKNPDILKSLCDRRSNIAKKSRHSELDSESINVDLSYEGQNQMDRLQGGGARSDKELSAYLEKGLGKGLSPIIIGFCAESENLLENAKEKISKKGCDYLVANDISRRDIGFGADENEVTILDKNGGILRLEKASKIVIARQILEIICHSESCSES